MSRISSVSLPGPTAVTSFIREHASAGDGAATSAAGMAAVAGATPLAVTVPLVAQSLSEEKSIELLAKTDQKLDETIEGLDEERHSHQCLATVLRGVATVLPESDQYSDPSLRTAEGEPENLATLFQAYQGDSAYRQQVEETIERVLAGDLDESELDDDHDDFVDYLRDAFGTETRDEALAMFLDFRELLQAREVHEAIEQTHDIELGVAELEEKLDATRETLVTKLDAILAADLADEGFERLSPHYFRRSGRKPTPDPETCWRAGFRFPDVRAGYPLDRTVELDDGERRRVTPHLVEQLREGTDTVVLGLPGSGKSTILQSVACHWYKHQYGAVFYRQSSAKVPFDNHRRLEECVDDAEGHVLVVVEDANRRSTEALLDVMETYEHDSSVSFLLDSRFTEWKADDHRITDAREGLLKEHVEPFKLRRDRTLTRRECERAVEHFEATTGIEVGATPERLYRDIETELGAGEMYLLGYRLSSYSPALSGDARQWSDLRSEVRSVYNDLAPADGHDSEVLPWKVGLLFAILTAAEVDIHREYLASLAETEAEYRRVLQVLGEQQGRLHYGRNPRTGTYRTNHPLWTLLFLEEGLNRDDEHEELAIRNFEDAVNALFELLGDAERRTEVTSWVRTGASVLDSSDEGAAEPASQAVHSIFAVGGERPALASYFGTTVQSRIGLPEICDSEVQLDCAFGRSAMFQKRGGAVSDVTGQGMTDDIYGEFQHQPDAGVRPDVRSDFDRAEAELEWIRETLDSNPAFESERLQRNNAWVDVGLGSVALRRGDLETAERHLDQARTRFEDIGDDHSATKCLLNLGEVARGRGEFETAERRFEQAQTGFEDIGDDHSATKCLLNLGEVARGRGEFETAERRFDQAQTGFEDIGDDHSATKCLANLGGVAQGRGEFETAERRFEQARRGFEDIGDDHSGTTCLANLGAVALGRGDLKTAECRFEQARRGFEDIGDDHSATTCLMNLGEVAQGRGEFETAERRFEQARIRFEEIGDDHSGTKCLMNLGAVALGRGDLKTAECRFEQARRGFEDIGDEDGVARCTANLGRINFKRRDYEAARVHYEDARIRFEQIGDQHMVAMMTDYLGEVAQQQGDLELACDRFETAFEWFLALDILRDARPCLRSLTETYGELDDEERVAEGLERIIDAAERTGHPELAHALREDLEHTRNSE